MMKYDLKVGVELELKKEINQYGIYMQVGEKAIVDNVDFDKGTVALAIKGRGD